MPQIRPAGACRHVGAGHKAGNVVVTMTDHPVTAGRAVRRPYGWAGVCVGDGDAVSVGAGEAADGDGLGPVDCGDGDVSDGDGVGE